jgi:phosphate:Na+ symporter
MCGSLATALAAANQAGSARPEKGTVPVAEIADALRRAQEFMSEASGPPESEDEQRRLTNTLHALDHASRLVETAGEIVDFEAPPDGPEDLRAAEVCAEAMRNAATLAAEVALPAPADRPTPTRPASKRKGSPESGKEIPATGASTEQVHAQLAHCAEALGELRRDHRRATLSSVANGEVTVDEAIARVDTVRRLEALAHHAWRSAAHLMGRGT